ncbi:hypothetical protein [Streptococcus suis]|uniref:hypothetical protein n=1 Tax=Streptococcus suis TaxID=1307 RepID=UPI002A793C3E|nr:hypothetical protein [Streptococcus suis]HEL1911310.1 hypothetical protein [Streptococcus suis]HEL2063345.1 hypothetical protein [Streptococcus suis]HEL2409800.1 hypothetical protein [Streptococcus suis]HEL2438745.1 hypothetical protein [Streptococcus suis]
MDVWIASTKNTVSNKKTVLNGLFFHELENKRASYGPVDHFFFAYRNKRGLFSCVIAKMIAIGLHTHELSKLMGCVGVKHYISYSFKIKNSHLPLKVDMERFDFVIF